MRPLKFEEKKTLYRFTKTALVIIGLVLMLYGGWFIVSQLMTAPHDSRFLFGIFPAYIGSMMIILSVAMKVEWFTDARRFW